MFWRRRETVWPIDPARVALGSVISGRDKNLSRSHVRVNYRHTDKVQFVPVDTFIRRSNEAIRDRRSLKIDHLLVAPLIKQRYAKFFDRLTDWGPATQRALGCSSRR